MKGNKWGGGGGGERWGVLSCFMFFHVTMCSVGDGQLKLHLRDYSTMSIKYRLVARGTALPLCCYCVCDRFSVVVISLYMVLGCVVAFFSE